MQKTCDDTFDSTTKENMLEPKGNLESVTLLQNKEDKGTSYLSSEDDNFHQPLNMLNKRAAEMLTR